MLGFVMERLADRVPELRGRLYAAADLQAILSGAAAAPQGVSAHVLPAALSARGGESAAGLFTQIVDEVVSVLVVYRHAGAAGERAAPEIRDMRMRIIAALAGSAPDDTAGDFVFRAARLQPPLPGGTLLDQIDFSIQDQLRITP